MFEKLPSFPPDKIISLMEAYRADTRSGKIDLGAGVYKDEAGNTPVMAAIREAERRLAEQQETKAYTALAGEAAFRELMAQLVLGEAVRQECIASIATPGGTGACHQSFELIKLLKRGARVFISDPSWPNHRSMLVHLGIETYSYRYLDAEAGSVDFDGMKADLEKLQPGDVLLMHGCCHNPSGANLRPEEMLEAGRIAAQRGATVMIDIAYQGFGEGLEEDARGVRLLASELPELLIAASCSKNFGVYRERVGILMAIGEAAHRQELQTTLNYLNRQNYSFPPDHGARAVSMVLHDKELRASWESELSAMRNSMLSLRETLSRSLQAKTGSDRFGFIGANRGMFSLMGLGSEQIKRLRDEHAIYMVGDSRINIAGLSKERAEILAEAVAATL